MLELIQYRDGCPPAIKWNRNTIDITLLGSLNSVIQAAKAYVAAVSHDEQPENWPVLFDILRDAVEEL